MRLARIGPHAAERPVVISDTSAFDASDVAADYDAAFFASDGPARLRAALDGGHLPLAYLDGERFGPPIARPSAVFCIGLNYALHAAESGQPLPTEPVLFMKTPNTVVGPNDDIVVPRNSTKTDWEIELAVVIGRQASYLDSRDDANAYIAGYAISNDVSEREFQLERGGQWSKGKSCPTFNPLGPYLVTPDEIGDPTDLELSLSVNGQRRQHSTTADMIFDVHHIVWYLSQFSTLEPGDLINTGTPAGVALGLPDQPYLRAGDVVELSISGLGSQRQQVVAP